MSYVLRKSKTKNGPHFQVYFCYFDSKLKQPRNKYVKSFGLEKTLIKKGIKDPTKFCKEEVAKMNKKRRTELEQQKIEKISSNPVEFNLGYFLIKSLIDLLEIDYVSDIFSQDCKYQFKFSEMLRNLIYAQIIHPASKLKFAEDIIPTIYDSPKYSEDQIYEACEFIGENYKKIIEMFNYETSRIIQRKYNNLYFDCTNYYFEIDLEKDDKQKGPSKENRHSPIIGQALLLDSDSIPLAMEMYPGNQSEKPMIRKLIEETKKRYRITGKTIQVADKGLNTAKNIYLAKKNNDGYIFSKSIHGKGLSEKEKSWVILESGFKTIYDENKEIKFRYKECKDYFDYKFTDENNVEHKFKIYEKRVVSYNPSLAKKQIQEIDKLIEKAKKLNGIKSIEKQEYGSSVKYVNFNSADEEGEIVKITPTLNYQKINEDKKYAGYNLIVTSEYKADALEIYRTYHNLSKIEESFRVTKSILEARPIYLQTKEKIYGHFTICYLALFLLRLLETKIFENRINSYDIVDFIRNFKITKGPNEIYINNLKSNNKGYIKLIKEIKNEEIERLYLTKSDIKKILKPKFNCAMFL